MELSEPAAVARFGIAKETMIAKAIEKETPVERRKEPLLGIQSHTSSVRHPGRTSRAEHIKPIQWRGRIYFCAGIPGQIRCKELPGIIALVTKALPGIGPIAFARDDQF